MSFILWVIGPNWHSWFWPPTWSNWALAAVAVWGIRVALRNLEAIKRQGDIMERQTKAIEITAHAALKSAQTAENALRLSERADILLESAGIVFSPSQVFDGDARLVLRFRNWGRTRATDVRFDVRMIIPGIIDSSAPPLPLMVLGAGQEQSVSFQTFREHLAKNTFEDIAAGRADLQFVSWLVYKDVFGGSYTTRDVGVFNHRTVTFRVEEQNAG